MAAPDDEEFVDHYQVLGVDEAADKKAITKAYRKLALKFHPDKVADDAQRDAAEKMFDRISKSHAVLTDDKRRAKFDGKIKARVMKRKREQEMDDKRREMRDALRKREEEASAGRRTQFPSGLTPRKPGDGREERIRLAREANDRLTRALMRELEAEAVARVAAAAQQQQEELRQQRRQPAARGEADGGGAVPGRAGAAAPRPPPPPLHVGVPEPAVMSHEEYEAATFAAVEAAIARGVAHVVGVRAQ